MIKLLFLDVDGTLTDGAIHISENGELFKSFNVKDGFALTHILPESGVVPIVLTGRTSRIVGIRMIELGITEIYQGVSDKATKVRELTAQRGCKLDEVSYIGDDLNDYAAMQLCGFKACPADAITEIRDLCDYVSPFSGGHGAVRDIIEWMKTNEL